MLSRNIFKSTTHSKNRLISVHLDFRNDKPNDDYVTKKTFTSADEYLKYYGFKHINAYYVKTIYAGYDYGDVDFHYHTYPLSEALSGTLKNPNLELIELLLKAGADPNIKPKMCYPILHGILINSNQWNDKTIPLIKLLIKYGANVNLKSKGDKNTPLHEVAYAWAKPYAEEIIELLIDNGAKINVWNSKLKTPYVNMLESHEWIHYKHLEIPEKIRDMLNPVKRSESRPVSQIKYNKE